MILVLNAISKCNSVIENILYTIGMLCNVKLIGKHNGRTIEQYDKALVLQTVWMVPIYFLCCLHFLEYSRPSHLSFNLLNLDTSE